MDRGELMTVVIDMTPREAYDRIVEHFSKEGARFGYNLEARRCSYRTSDGRACAVGCLLSDEDAAKLERVIEDYGVVDVPNGHLFDFLRRAQVIHDREALAAMQGDGSIAAFLDKLEAYASTAGIIEVNS
jgi:hypothetical protein